MFFMEILITGNGNNNWMDLDFTVKPDILQTLFADFEKNKFFISPRNIRKQCIIKALCPHDILSLVEGKIKQFLLHSRSFGREN